MNIETLRADMVLLANELLDTIGDDYRVEGQEDETPMMDVTIGADADGWSYQTGDNSFSGGAYSYRDWAVTTLTRDTDPADFASEVISQLDDLCADAAPIFEDAQS